MNTLHVNHLLQPQQFYGYIFLKERPSSVAKKEQSNQSARAMCFPEFQQNVSFQGETLLVVTTCVANLFTYARRKVQLIAGGEKTCASEWLTAVLISLLTVPES